MTVTSATPATRKRGAALEDAIHDAVFAELAEVGYAAFTIEAAAVRAQTGKASIYRRWETKQDLVLDAFIARFGRPDDIVSELLVDTEAPTRRPASSAAYADHAALDAFHAVQAHGSSQGFLVAAVFGIVAVVAALVLINVRRSDMSQMQEAAVAVA